MMQEAKSTETYLSTGETAKLLGRSAEWVRLQERRGVLRALKTEGGCRIFPRSAVLHLRAKLAARAKGGEK